MIGIHKCSSLATTTSGLRNLHLWQVCYPLHHEAVIERYMQNLED